MPVTPLVSIGSCVPPPDGGDCGGDDGSDGSVTGGRSIPASGTDGGVVEIGVAGTVCPAAAGLWPELGAWTGAVV
jgi:hypothetical protein